MFIKSIPKKFIKIIIALEVIVGVSALVFIAWALWNKPLGPSLGLTDVVNAQVDQIINSSGAGSQHIELQTTGVPLEGTPTPETLLGHIASLIKPAAPKNTPVNTLCGGPPVMTLLVIGTDQRSNDYYYGLADSIRLVRVDFVQPSVMVLDVPRDLWVEIPGIADHGVDHGKLNQAYLFGSPGMGYYKGPGEGPGLMARTLELNFGFRGIDHYFVMDMQTFRNVVNTVGGIDIYVDSTVDLNDGEDGANLDYVLGPGQHHLDGDMALKLSRDRHPTIFQRARYQNVVLKALKAKLLSPAIIPDLPGLISEFSKSVRTDLSAKDINQLICIGQKFTDENTHFVAFPDKIFGNGDTYDPYRKVYTYTLDVDFDVLRDYFANFMNGTWPTQ